jgi:hypothetical protein
MSLEALQSRIKRSDKLRALYGHKGVDNEISAPTATDAARRTPADRPTPPNDEIDIQMAELVTDSNNRLFHSKLEELGISEKMRKKLLSLDGLAKNAGTLLTTSLDKTHRIYFVQLIELAEDLTQLRADLNERTDAGGYKIDDHVHRSFYLKVAVEMAKELGRGYNTMLTGTEAMVRIIGGQKKPGGKSNRAKPGWGELKRVSPTEHPPAPADAQA